MQFLFSPTHPDVWPVVLGIRSYQEHCHFWVVDVQLTGGRAGRWQEVTLLPGVWKAGIASKELPSTVLQQLALAKQGQALELLSVFGEVE
jgi:hypothetical protein